MSSSDYLDPFRVRVDIEICSDRQSLTGLGAGNQIDYHLQTLQRATAPIGGNVAKHPMLDFVPFAGSGRKMTDHDAQSGFIRQFLQLVLPQPRPIVVTASRIGGNQ